MDAAPKGGLYRIMDLITVIAFLSAIGVGGTVQPLNKELLSAKISGSGGGISGGGMYSFFVFLCLCPNFKAFDEKINCSNEISNKFESRIFDMDRILIESF